MLPALREPLEADELRVAVDPLVELDELRVAVAPLRVAELPLLRELVLLVEAAELLEVLEALELLVEPRRTVDFCPDSETEVVRVLVEPVLLTRLRTVV